MQTAARRLKLSWRIGVPLYETDAAFEELKAFLLRHRGIVDEIAFFDSLTHHLYLPLDVIAGRMRIIADRIVSLKTAGVASAGINVLATLGHLNEAWDIMPPLPFQPMVGHDGRLSTGCACPNTPGLREYVRAKYRLAAGARPDFIWVDDDIRMHHHGVDWACFCPTCLGIFNRAVAGSYTRETLVAAFDDPASSRLREAWIEQNTSSIESLLAEVAAAISSVDPSIETGLMTASVSWSLYSGRAFPRWLAALDAHRVRPGGGFYEDRRPFEMYGKTLDAGRQLTDIQASVTDRQYELENFPYAALGKSLAAFETECTLALAFGHNGIAMNALGDSVAEREPLAARVKKVRPYWETLVSHAEGLPGAGLWPAWTSLAMARRRVRPGRKWLSDDKWYQFRDADALAEIGIPLCPGCPGDAVILFGRIAEAMDDDQLREMLAGGVLLDSVALDVLETRGLGALAGARIAERLDNGVLERFTGDDLNGEFSDRVRDARIEFWGDAAGLADVLEPLDPRTRVITMMEDYLGATRGPAMTAFENDLGGRVVVMGYARFMFVGSAPKRTQLQNAADWATRGRLAVRIDETVRLVPVARLSPDRRRGAIVLVNAGLDPIESATVHVRAPLGPVRIAHPSGAIEPLEARAEPGGWSVVVRSLAPWSTAAILIGG